jgi:hypothetical protein
MDRDVVRLLNLQELGLIFSTAVTKRLPYLLFSSAALVRGVAPTLSHAFLHASLEQLASHADFTTRPVSMSVPP